MSPPGTTADHTYAAADGTKQSSNAEHIAAAQIEILTTNLAGRQPTGVKPLVDSGHTPKLSTLAPRYGEFSVDSASLWSEFVKEPFHAFVALPMPLLLILYLAAYAIFIFLTAFLFWLIALGDDNALTPDSTWRSCVLCAWQSVTTVGYGGIATNSVAANVVGAIAVVTCLIFDAVGIGVVYEHISSAATKKKSILHSSHACVCRAQCGMPVRFECRVHHISDYALVEPHCKLTMARFHSGQDGEGRVAIEVEELAVSNRTGIALLQYPWSVVHYVDADSPLAKYVRISATGEPSATDSFAAEHVEVICTLTGAAPTTGNVCESRHSYTVHNTRFGHRFADALVHHPSDHTLTVDRSKLGETLPEDPAQPLRPQCY